MASFFVFSWVGGYTCHSKEVLALLLAMHKHLEYDQYHQKKQESSDTQDVIFHNLKQTTEIEENKETKEKMDKDVEAFQRLAQYYYDINMHANEQEL